MKAKLVNELWGRILRTGRYSDAEVSTVDGDTITGQFGLADWNGELCVIVQVEHQDRVAYIDPKAIVSVKVASFKGEAS